MSHPKDRYERRKINKKKDYKKKKDRKKSTKKIRDILGLEDPISLSKCKTPS